MINFQPFFSLLYFTTYINWPDKLFFYSFFSIKFVGPYDHYAAQCVPLMAVCASDLLIAGGCKQFLETTAVQATCGIPCIYNGLIATVYVPMMFLC